MVEHFRRGLAERDANTLPEDWPSTETWTEQTFPGFVANFGLTLLRQMIEHPQVMETFGNLNWWCQEFGEDDPALLLADFPLHTEEKLADPDFMMMMPIAPDRAFFGTRSANTKHRLASLDLAELAQRLNKASIASAAERIWARDEAPAYAAIEANLPSMGVNTSEFRTLAPWIGQQTSNAAQSG